jgi:hypothetical protein
MISASKKTELTPDSILSLVSEYQIFRYYMGRDFKLNHTISSPFRRDDNPSFSIMSTSGGRLYYTDFAKSEFRGTCFDLVMQLFSLGFHEGLRKIDSDLGLGIGGGKVDYKTKTSLFKEPKLEKADTFIQVKSKKYDPSDLSYWNSYHITHEDLTRNGVYSVGKLYINRKLYYTDPHDLCFGYLLDDKWKIYWPHAKTKKDKWRTNVPIDRMWGMDDIKPGCNKSVIVKSLKELMIIQKLLPSVAAVQNESTIAINTKNIKILQNNCKEVYISFDNDGVGVSSSKFYTDNFGFKWINPPKEYLPKIKDWADLVKEKGMETLINYFKSKNII